MSTKKAWQRVFSKLSPSKNVGISPIKHVCYHSATDSLLKERYTEVMIWTLLTTEEFFYQDTCSLVYHNYGHKSKLKRFLNNSRTVMDWGSKLENFEMIGKGSFGEVYVANDKETGKMYALKRIIQTETKAEEDAEQFIREILLEKSTLFEINKCPLFIRLIGTYVGSNSSSYWFVMEYCICDLSKITKPYPYSNDNDRLWDIYINDNALENANDYFSSIYDVEYTKLILIYLFEMLSALYYLAHRHIIHADLKTQNILISTTGHIKIGDFGVAFRHNWFYRNSLIYIANSEEERENMESLDCSYEYQGNTMHYDPEITINRWRMKGKKYVKAMNKKYSENKYYERLTSFNQEFMTDLYAVGLITIELLTGGLRLKINPPFQTFKMNPFWSIDLAYDEIIHKDIITDRLLLENQNGNSMDSVLELIDSIFTPRRIRAKDYTSTIKVFIHNKFKTNRYIDITKVENIPYYSENNIKMLNVLSKRLPINFISNIESRFANNFVNEDSITKFESDSKSGFTEKIKPAKIINHQVYSLPGFCFTDTKHLD